jgi:pyruvate/2-oxoglutarate dehydrogenase complex dihydrolipoamide acyltransferase (E2) component
MTVCFSTPDETSTFRRIAASMWSRPNDPSIYGFIDVDVSETLQFIEDYRAQTGEKLTITHVVAQAVARAFAQHPELNAKVRFGGRVEQRDQVDLFLSVATAGGRDLSGVKIEQADRLPLSDLLREISNSARRTRDGEDEVYERSRGLLGSLPWWMLRPILWLTDFVTNELHLHLPSQGMPRDPFGSAMITNVGGFGIDTAFAPFLPMGRSPMLLLVTKVRDRPWVVDGEVVVRPVLRLCATFDHRIVDGYQAGLLAKVIMAEVQHPSDAGVQPIEFTDALTPQVAATAVAMGRAS